MRWWSLCSVVLLLLVVGCKPADPIRAYTVPKETRPSSAIPTDAQAFRFLGAVLPIDDKYAFFVKFVGPTAVISAEAKAFDDFLGSVGPVGDSTEKPKYTIPDGWTLAADKPTRIVTITKGKAEMYLSGPFGGTLLENINRWRKEIGLRELRSDELAGGVKEIPYGKGNGFRMDESGPVWNAGMGRPMMGK
jgi:hypothetical protein